MNRPIKVMLIDDDPGIHESLRAVVEEAGYEFCGALGGREGLRLLDDEHPDLLLLDVMMPGMNGFDVCQKMREEGRRIPVIFLTAKNDIVDKSTGFKAGADDYVTSPSSPMSCCCASTPTCGVIAATSNMRAKIQPMSMSRCAASRAASGIWKCSSIATKCTCTARQFR